ncbi:MAG: hypothetical protein V3R95_05740 [Dehalococcoidia bacterium]
MAWLKSIFRRESSGSATEREVSCAHVNLTPRWDDVADVGHADKASGYHCIACGESFTIAQAEAMGRIPAA